MASSESVGKGLRGKTKTLQGSARRAGSRLGRKGLVLCRVQRWGKVKAPGEEEVLGEATGEIITRSLVKKKIMARSGLGCSSIDVCL